MKLKKKYGVKLDNNERAAVIDASGTVLKINHLRLINHVEILLEQAFLMGLAEAKNEKETDK